MGRQIYGWHRAILAVACVSLWDGTAYAASMEDELTGLVANHPLIRSGQEQVTASDKGVAASLAPYLPSADFYGEQGEGRVSLPAFRATGGPFASSEENYDLSLKENVWDGEIRDSARAQSKLQRDSANITLVGTRQNVIGEGIAAYLNVLRQLELVKFSEANTDNIKTQLNLEDERVQRGSGIAVDVLQAKSRLQIALERLAAIHGGLQEATVRYQQVFDTAPDFATMTMPPDPAKLLPASVDEVVSVALKEHPTIQNAAKQIDLTAEKKEGIAAEYQPRVDIVGVRDYQSNYSGVPGIRRDTLAELRVTWNLFGGLGTLSRVRQTAHEEAAREDDLLQAKRKAEEAARVAWNALKTAEERVSLLENAVNIASEVFDSRKKLRESGKDTSLDVLDAENEVFNAQINYTSALYDTRLATYEVLRSMGRLELATLKNAK